MLFPDHAERDADWIKTRTWDAPTDPDELIAAYGLPRKESARAILALPAAEAMPSKTRKALERIVNE